MRILYPSNPAFGDRFVYIDPIGGASWVTVEWLGLLGWVFISRE